MRTSICGFGPGCSGSIGGESLEAARRALTTLIGLLEPRDRFGLVVFHDHAKLLPRPPPCSPLGSRRVSGGVVNIASAGCTDLSAGYLVRPPEAGRAFGGGGATILLIRDGHANAGETSPVALGNLAERPACKGSPRPQSVTDWGVWRNSWSLWPRWQRRSRLAEDVDQFRPASAGPWPRLLPRPLR